MSSDKAVLDVIAWVLKDDCAESELVEKLNAHLEAKHPELNAAPTTSERFRGRTPLSLAIRKHKPEVVQQIHFFVDNSKKLFLPRLCDVSFVTVPIPTFESRTREIIR